MTLVQAERSAVLVLRALPLTAGEQVDRRAVEGLIAVG